MNISEEIEAILNTFTSKIVDINNYQSFINNSTRRSLEYYHEQAKLRENTNLDDLIDFHSTSTWNIKDDSQINLEITENTLDDLIEITQLQNNRQYQGLLVDAYESFLKYLDELYAYLSYKDNNFWSDKISKDILTDKNLEWFLQTLKKKHNRIEIIFSKLKEKMPTIELLEKSNPKGIDYSFEIKLIAELRHVITHNRGVVEDIEALISKIIPNISTYKKDIQNDLKKQVLYYIGKVNSDNFVLLLEFYHKGTNLVFTRYNDRLGELISKLAAYAILLKDLSAWYLSDNKNLKELVTSEEKYRKFFSSSDLYGYLK